MSITLPDPLQFLRSQHQHLVRINTTLGQDALFVHSLSAQLGMSTLDQFSIHTYSDTLHNIQPAEIIGTPVNLTIIDENGEQSPYHAYVFNFDKKSPSMTGQSTEYEIELKPWLYFLEHESDCRIFQNVTISDVLHKILQPYAHFGKYTINLQRNYPEKRYLVQYNETNLNFFHRLCHYHQIAYYFTYEENQHHLHIIDTAMPLFSLEPKVVKYLPSTQACDHLVSWERSSHYVTGNREQRSYNYKLPFDPLINKQTVEGKLAETPRVKATSHYHFIEDFLLNQEFAEHNQRGLTETVERQHVVNARGDCRFLKIARKFSAEPVPSSSYFPDKGKIFTLINLRIDASNVANNNEKANDEDSHHVFQAHLTAVPEGELTYPKEFAPVTISSLQTAIVTGPEGAEIHTDKEGRIKVQFHWDRLGKHDQNTTCWLRVMQSFAGPGFGAQFTPRIGQEVVVAFENGNPDRPFVTGALYHSLHSPPYANHQGTRNGIRTRSTRNGSTTQRNELYFEDKKDNEEVFIHAQKDMNTVVDTGDRTVTLNVGDETKTIAQGNLTESIALQRSTTANTVQVQAKTADAGPGTQLYEADEKVELRVGDSSILMDTEKIVLRHGSSSITLNASGIDQLGPIIQLNKDKGESTVAPISAQQASALANLVTPIEGRELTQDQVNQMSPNDLLSYFGGTVMENGDGQDLYFGPDSKMSQLFSQGEGAKTFEKFVYDKYGGTLTTGNSVDNFDHKFDPSRFFGTSNYAEHVIGSWEDGQARVVDDQILFRARNTMGVSSFFAGRYTEKWFDWSMGPKASDVSMMIEWTSPVKQKK